VICNANRVGLQLFSAATNLLPKLFARLSCSELASDDREAMSRAVLWSPGLTTAVS
jgi:hypothetical protein